MDGKLIESKLSNAIIGCAISVHKELGPGFLEKFYEQALCIELERQRLNYLRQAEVTPTFRDKPVGVHRIDLIVENKIIVELKAVRKFEDIHYATVLSYLKAARVPVALLLNFNAPTLTIRRFAHSIFRVNAETRKGGNTEGLVKFVRDEDNNLESDVNY